MNPTTIGLDIAKNVFQAHGVDRNGHGPGQVRRGVAMLLEREDPRLSGMAREVLEDLRAQLNELDQRNDQYDVRVREACSQL